MSLWQVKIEGEYIHIGDVKRRKTHPHGCNERFKDVYWCPRKRWFNRAPCPFVNWHECDIFQRMCGNI